MQAKWRLPVRLLAINRDLVVPLVQDELRVFRVIWLRLPEFIGKHVDSSKADNPDFIVFGVDSLQIYDYCGGGVEHSLAVLVTEAKDRGIDI